MALKDLITIVFCSSNREHPIFEQRIRDSIIKNCGDIPIISVTQKPVDFGENICVGTSVGVSGFNYFAQTLIGCKKVKTPFVLSCDADCLYPPDHFQWVPPKDDVCYRNSNTFVMGDHRNYWYHKPEGATHSQIVGRDYYIETLEKLFDGAPKWSKEEKNFPKERHKKADVFDKIEYFETENPVFQIKTHRAMRHYTRSERVPIHTLPYWGDGKKIRDYYFKDVPEVYSQI
jgi:hypothetical protein